MGKGKVIRLRENTVQEIKKARNLIILSDGEFYNDCLTDDNIIWIALNFWLKNIGEGELFKKL